jgi:hypothetical protein
MARQKRLVIQRLEDISWRIPEDYVQTAENEIRQCKFKGAS